MAIVTAIAMTLVTVPTISAATGRDTGISTGTSLLWMDEAQLEYRLQDMENLGAAWIRVEFNWAEIQPESSDSYKWGAYDRVIQAANKHHLNILATLAYTPAWARNGQCVHLVRSEEARRKCSPANALDFGQFARSTVLRYKSQGLHAWEIWNEPNLTGYWKKARANNSITADPLAYARIANTAAQAIKDCDPNAFIIAGGLAPMFDRNSVAGMRQGDYLARILPHLNKDLFNAVGIHPYSWPKLPGSPASYNAFYTVDKDRPQYNLRTIMGRAGWEDKQIWATEFGASTRGARREGAMILLKARPDHVSESKQARIIRQGIDMWSRKPNVGPIFVHADSDRWLLARKNESGFGLRRSNGTKKPAYEAFKQSSHRLRVTR